MRYYRDKHKKVSVANFRHILYEKFINDHADSFLAT